MKDSEVDSEEEKDVVAEIGGSKAPLSKLQSIAGGNSGGGGAYSS